MLNKEIPILVFACIACVTLDFVASRNDLVWTTRCVFAHERVKQLPKQNLKTVANAPCNCIFQFPQFCPKMVMMERSYIIHS